VENISGVHKKGVTTAHPIYSGMPLQSGPELTQKGIKPNLKGRPPQVNWNFPETCPKCGTLGPHGKIGEKIPGRDLDPITINPGRVIIKTLKTRILRENK